jgi:hypothetical protein
MMLNLKNVLMLLPLSAALACGPMQEDTASAEQAEGTEVVETTASETDPAESVSAENDEGQTESFAIAPSCIQRTLYTKPNCYGISNNCVRLYNTCSTRRSVKVVIDNGPDSGCWSMGVREVRYHYYSFGSYQYTVTC